MKEIGGKLVEPWGFLPRNYSLGLEASLYGENFGSVENGRDSSVVKKIKMCEASVWVKILDARRFLEENSLICGKIKNVF